MNMTLCKGIPKKRTIDPIWFHPILLFKVELPQLHCITSNERKTYRVYSAMSKKAFFAISICDSKNPTRSKCITIALIYQNWTRPMMISWTQFVMVKLSDDNHDMPGRSTQNFENYCMQNDFVVTLTSVHLSGKERNHIPLKRRG